MDRLKKFLGEKKKAKIFKKAGTGRRLVDDQNKVIGQASSAQSSAAPVDRIFSSDAAAHAAYKRMNLGAKTETAAQRNIRLKAMKELELEKREHELESGGSNVESNIEKTRAGVQDISLSVKELEHSNAIQAVYFKCDLLGEDVKLTKAEMKEHIEDFLRSNLHEDPLVASSLMLFSLNEHKKRQLASETLQKYVQNIIENPDEAKYRRIRLNNKAFQERVLGAKGGREFLEACGFHEVEYASDGSSTEKFLLMDESCAENLASLLQALEILQSGQVVPLKLHRDPLIYKLTSEHDSKHSDMPNAFFDLSSAELKKEQAAKEAEVDKLTSLRTRKMRECDEILHSYRYKYTLIKVKFPNHFVLQGTFGTEEGFAAVLDFVREYLVPIEPQLFSIVDSVSSTVLSDESKSLNDLKLVPAAVLHFEWDADLKAHLAQSNGNQIALVRRLSMEKLPEESAILKNAREFMKKLTEVGESSKSDEEICEVISADCSDYFSSDVDESTDDDSDIDFSSESEKKPCSASGLTLLLTVHSGSDVSSESNDDEKSPEGFRKDLSRKRRYSKSFIQVIDSTNADSE